MRLWWSGVVDEEIESTGCNSKSGGESTSLTTLKWCFGRELEFVVGDEDWGG